MTNLIKIILMISMFAITETYVNCQFKEIEIISDEEDHYLNIEEELNDSESINEIFIHNIENQDLDSIENFMQFIVQNVERNRVTEIFYSCLNILNPEHSDTIIEQLSNIDNEKIDLNFLNITTKQLYFIIYFLGQFINLKHLYLSHNQLTKLPYNIGYLENITHLNLSNNKLKTLPEDIGNIRNLELLDISCNELTELPYNIGDIRNLTHLDISCNKLTRLPVTIEQLTNLTNLNLSWNLLSANIAHSFLYFLTGRSINGFNVNYETSEDIHSLMISYFRN